MTLQSAPYYWITCDATDCDNRCPDEISEATAWERPDHAEADAAEAGWVTDDAGRWFCTEHPRCGFCQDPVDDPDMVWADDELWHQACMPGGAPVGLVRQLITNMDAAERGAYPQRVWVGDQDGASE